MVLEMEMSKTYQYRKVMKPMLERKRRARINKCLDELKDIMVECLTQEGEHITRLEKADILELTVEHMKKLRAQKQLRLNGSQDAAKLTIAESFRAGYIHAANEVSKTLASVPGVNVDLGTQLMSHLGHRLNYLQVIVPTAATSAVSLAMNQQASNSPSTTISTTTSISTSTLTSTSTTPIIAPILSNKQTHLNVSYLRQKSVDSVLITPPPSEYGSSESNDSSNHSDTCSPAPTESGSMWRPW